MSDHPCFRLVGACACLMLLSIASAPDRADAAPASQSGVPPQRLLLTRAEVPLYPELAMAARISGTVRVRLLVANGATVEADAAPGAPELLRLAAQANARTWRFARGTEGAFEVEYVYELAGEATQLPENPRVEMELPWLVRITGRPARAAAPRR